MDIQASVILIILHYALSSLNDGFSDHHVPPRSNDEQSSITRRIILALGG